MPTMGSRVLVPYWAFNFACPNVIIIVFYETLGITLRWLIEQKTTYPYVLNWLRPRLIQPLYSL